MFDGALEKGRDMIAHADDWSVRRFRIPFPGAAFLGRGFATSRFLPPARSSLGRLATIRFGVF